LLGLDAAEDAILHHFPHRFRDFRLLHRASVDCQPGTA
jgi:hypothetical protein